MPAGPLIPKFALAMVAGGVPRVDNCTVVSFTVILYGQQASGTLSQLVLKEIIQLSQMVVPHMPYMVSVYVPVRFRMKLVGKLPVVVPDGCTNL